MYCLHICLCLSIKYYYPVLLCYSMRRLNQSGTQQGLPDKYIVGLPSCTIQWNLRIKTTLGIALTIRQSSDTTRHWQYRFGTEEWSKPWGVFNSEVFFHSYDACTGQEKSLQSWTTCKGCKILCRENIQWSLWLKTTHSASKLWF